MSGRYAVEFKPSARKQLRRLDSNTRARILRKITSLADEPRPAGVVKMSGEDDAWRIRIGDYRVVYTIEDDRLVVVVIRIAHRREVYR